jgi:hypothetical protein
MSRGEPRIQYERTYVLLPPSAGADWVDAVIEATWNEKRYTIGGSADDAGIGDLDVRRVLAVNPGGWPGDLRAFFEQHYTGVEYAPIEASTPEELRQKLTGENQPPPPPPPGRELVSVHIQGNSTPAADYIRKVKPNVVKFVMGMERAQWVKAVSPDTLVVYRQWLNQGEFWEDPDPHRGARRYLETFLDSLHTNAQWIDYVESLNETIATGDTAGIQRTAAFDAAFCEALQDEGLPARPVILTAGVGNPQHGNEVKLMLPAVRACVNAGGAVGYHSYWGARSDGYCSMSDAWEHFGGRALESWDPVFRAAGLYPHYIFGECGAVYISGGHMPSAEAGWGYRETLNGDAQKYVAQILEFRRRLMEWNHHHGNRVLGATLFTAGGGSDWHHFELTVNVLGPLADAVS